MPKVNNLNSNFALFSQIRDLVFAFWLFNKYAKYKILPATLYIDSFVTNVFFYFYILKLL